MSRTAAESLASPRIDALRRDLENGRRGALAEFWRAIEVEGAPLIEPLGADESLVTFLWRDSGDAEAVRVVGGLASPLAHPNDSMDRLLDTDLWYRTYRTGNDFRGRYRFLINPDLDDPGSASLQELVQSLAPARPDPLNPALVVWPAFDSDPESRVEHSSLLELPGAPLQPWLQERTHVPNGAVEETTLYSGALGEERRVWVYRPAEQTKGTDLMVLLDGQVWMDAIPLAPTFNNLIAEGRIRPLTVVMVDSVTEAKRRRELALCDPFLAFLADELLPAVRRRWSPTNDPRRTIVAGQSLGGLTAAFAGLRLSHVFGNVLSQGGSFYWPQDRHWGANGATGGEWLTTAFRETPRLPLRFYIDVGQLDIASIRESNRRLRDVLRAKGYAVTYREFNGAHEHLCWCGTLAEGLIALVGRT